MPPEGITYEQIKSACKKIEEQGRKLTLRSIHAEAGGGSMQTISKHFRKYQSEKETTNLDLKLSDEIIQSLLSEIGGHVKAINNDLEKKLANAESNLDELTALLSDSEAQINDLILQVNSLKENETELKRATELRISSAEEKLKGSEARALELLRQLESERDARIETANRLAIAEAQMNDRDDQITSLERKLQASLTQIEATRFQIAEAEKKAAVAEALTGEKAIQISALELQLTDIKDSWTNLRLKLDETLDQKSEAETRAEVAEAEWGFLKSKYEKKKKKAGASL